uniref:peroxidase n=1 Tax=Wollemia nobilis TaxID=56998 RepID=A0A0C9S9C5_9CONI
MRPEVLAEIEKIKEKLEAVCPNTVSCADIVVLAGRDSVHLSKGPYFQIPTGRKDSLNYFLGNNITPDMLAGPTSTIDVLLKPFLQQRLSAIDLVALTGAHTVGTAHCSAFNGSLFPALAERLSQGFGQGLLQICQTPQSNSLTVNDMKTPFVFDNKYFTNLVAGQVLFNSDNALLANSESKKAVEEFASDQEEFFEQFAESYIKMSMLNVKTGSEGNIRKVCSILNSVGDKNLTGSSFNMMYAATDTIYSSS